MDYTLIVSLQSALLVIAIGIIGFFARDLVQKLKDLGEAIASLKLVVATESVKYIKFEENCRLKTDGIAHEFVKHEKKLLDHDEKINRHETEISLIKQDLGKNGKIR